MGIKIQPFDDIEEVLRKAKQEALEKRAKKIQSAKDAIFKNIFKGFSDKNYNDLFKLMENAVSFDLYIDGINILQKIDVATKSKKDKQILSDKEVNSVGDVFHQFGESHQY